MSYTQNFQHIIFRTKHSLPTIPLEYSPELYRFIWGFCKNRKSVLLQINGMREHLHIFVDLHPLLSVADFVKQLKFSTTDWLRANPHFPEFDGWADGYASLSYSRHEKEMIMNYIKNQRIHHARFSFADELRQYLFPLLSPEHQAHFRQNWLD